MRSALVLAATALASPSAAGPDARPFRLSEAQMASIGVSGAGAEAINAAVQFERGNWATGSVRTDDALYAVAPSEAAPGTVLRVEAASNTTRYTLAPGLALSRIVYQSRALDGSPVPVSAFVLWPYRARGGRRRAPLVAWGHGTSGIFAECAPSHVRNLWAQFSAPFALALAGFAVVGTDYAGLGVASAAAGSGREEPLTHQYLASPAAGNDLLYAARAAHAAFPHAVTVDFVVMGHSQGGSAAWAAAQQQQQLEAAVPGYLGAVAVAPLTNAIELARRGPDSGLLLMLLARSIVSVLRGISLPSLLTPAGIRLLDLFRDLQGCNSVWVTAVRAVTRADPPPALVREAFLASDDAVRFANLTAVGGKDFAGPLLVLHGTADNTVPEDLTAKYVNKTCRDFPRRRLDYVRARGMGHDSVLYATQPIWLDWLDRRFAEPGDRRQEPRAVPGGSCSVQDIGSLTPRPLKDYQLNLTYILEYTPEGYMTV